MRTIAAVLIALSLTMIPVEATAQEEYPCHLKHGRDGIARGVTMYFRDVMDDVISVLDSEQEGTIELHSDWLCWAPRSAQPIMIATAEHVLYLIFQVIPEMSHI